LSEVRGKQVEKFVLGLDAFECVIFCTRSRLPGLKLHCST